MNPKEMIFKIEAANEQFRKTNFAEWLDTIGGLLDEVEEYYTNPKQFDDFKKQLWGTIGNDNYLKKIQRCYKLGLFFKKKELPYPNSIKKFYKVWQLRPAEAVMLWKELIHAGKDNNTSEINKAVDGWIDRDPSTMCSQAKSEHFGIKPMHTVADDVKLRQEYMNFIRKEMGDDVIGNAVSCLEDAFRHTVSMDRTEFASVILYEFCNPEVSRC